MTHHLRTSAFSAAVSPLAAGCSTLGTPEPLALDDAIADYQATDAVYLVTESNHTFENRTSTLNAMPSLSDAIDALSR